MRTTAKLLYLGMALAVLLTASRVATQTPQGAAGSVRIDTDDLGGMVTSAKGPEAGVWVIAETRDLPTGFRKIVVTDDQGRYVVPDLPKANYSVWVRGYGLIDSPKVTGTPGKILNLTAVVAPNPRAAAEYYPANYWYSLVQPPSKSEFPGTGRQGNGISPKMQSQAQFIDMMQTHCQECHQMGGKMIREMHIPEAMGAFDSSADAWHWRVQLGQDSERAFNDFSNMGAARAAAMFADWTDRIAASELPPAPPRPNGVERNVVITQWDWSHEVGFVHDVSGTDKRNPTVNGNGPMYGVERLNTPNLLILDPVRNTVKGVTVPVRDANTPPQRPQSMRNPSLFFGQEVIWPNQAGVHNPMLDENGRVWMTSSIRAPETIPDFCTDGSLNPSAKLFPHGRSAKHVARYDPDTQKVTLIDTCFNTHHLYFAEDANRTLWFSGGGEVVGWLNTKMFDETGDAAKSQGWAPFILDTNGNGRRDAWVEPDDQSDPQIVDTKSNIDPTKDKRIRGGSYGLTPSPVDGSIWVAQRAWGGAIYRLDPGLNPPETTLAEIYQPPFENPKAPGIDSFSPRGIDVDRDGVVWTALASGHLASFDRRRCKVLNGPTATGQHCPEGWTLYKTPGPSFKGVTDYGSADFHYYNYVDQFNTFGLGESVPIAMGTSSDSLIALLPETKEWVVIRSPYPLGMYTRGLDGRIDDPKAGWKGRGLWGAYSPGPPWHIEGGKGQTSKAVKFQLRPDPLAK